MASLPWYCFEGNEQNDLASLTFVFSFYPDSNLYSYNIQNNDVFEFAADEGPVLLKPVELEGYLQKEGQKGVIKRWKSRWFSTQVLISLHFSRVALPTLDVDWNNC